MLLLAMIHIFFHMFSTDADVISFGNPICEFTALSTFFIICYRILRKYHYFLHSTLQVHPHQSTIFIFIIEHSLEINHGNEYLTEINQYFFKYVSLHQPKTNDELKRIAQNLSNRGNFFTILAVLMEKMYTQFRLSIVKVCISTIKKHIADANYKIIYSGVGGEGRISDGIFKRRSFYETIKQGMLQLPEAEALRPRKKSIIFCLGC